MANTYFQFKEFTVHQDRAAMKVSTDACLFGAWVAHFCSFLQPTDTVLDIGTGTGLLSLMVAQRFSGTIVGIEIDPDAAQQASENFAASPWASRLTSIHGDIRAFNGAYDFIMTNPPFYANDLKSPDHQRNLARHSDTLDFGELIESIRRLLKPTGSFAILIPSYRLDELMEAVPEYICYSVVFLKHSPKHDIFRAMAVFGYPKDVANLGIHSNPMAKRVSELIIQDQGNYTPRVLDLLRPYYLYL
jgi:tRNA1Val (adenine37-N6)-methyltransferase